MYKCLRLSTSEVIVILAPNWRSRLTELRRFDQDNELVCQGCLQPVRVRAGKFRRWHFAHKHLHNCPFQQASPALLHTRAVLYDWFCEILGAQAVDVETLVPGIDLPRPLDIWVNLPDNRFACWIIETRLQPGVRQQLQAAFEQISIPVLIFFLEAMRNPDPNMEGVVYLTTTEREFSRQTACDILENTLNRPVGKSLHYLDANLNQLITLRDLHCIHTPQVYQGVMHVDKLDQVSLRLPEAEIIHPGEQERLTRLITRQTQRQRKIDTARQGLGKVLDRMLPDKSDRPNLTAPPMGSGQLLNRRQTDRLTLHPDQLLNRPAVCMFCGIETTAWWYLDRATGKCKCRDCLAKGIS